jgi:AraC-like DNA-binding protein/quercetin dioxygenase-like cupin family protein
MDKPRKAPQRRKRPAPAGAREHPVAGSAHRAVVARRFRYPAGHHIEPHWHRYSQFLFAVAGTMAVRTPRRAWIVPPSRALWIPAQTVHEIEMNGDVEMRSVYVNPSHAAGMPTACVVLDVTPLLRELIVRAAALPAHYDERGEDALLMRLLLAEIRRLPACALDLPLPESPDLTGLCEQVMASFATRRPCGDDAAALKTSTRTLYRRFLRETGITFARWKQQARLLEAIRRLGAGTPVTTVALDLGYESPSAFSTMFRRALGTVPRSFILRNSETSAAQDAR